jgi:small subunit ribosomal protein S4
MARYTGPKVKISRRLGVNIFENEKGRKALEKRPYPPGEHGRSRRRQPSEYSIQLQEKQKAKHIYGLLERQFENLYKEANRAKGVTGETLLRFLEQRLDNIVFRAGWARTRPQARQFVNHGMVDVNGKRVDIPSYRVRKGDVISLRDKPRSMIVIRHNLDTSDAIVPAWLETGDGGFAVTVVDLPRRDQIDVPVREQLIVELYSK